MTRERELTVAQTEALEGIRNVKKAGRFFERSSPLYLSEYVVHYYSYAPDEAIWEDITGFVAPDGTVEVEG